MHRMHCTCTVKCTVKELCTIKAYRGTSGAQYTLHVLCILQCARESCCWCNERCTLGTEQNARATHTAPCTCIVRLKYTHRCTFNCSVHCHTLTCSDRCTVGGASVVYTFSTRFDAHCTRTVKVTCTTHVHCTLHVQRICAVSSVSALNGAQYTCIGLCECTNH